MNELDDALAVAVGAERSRRLGWAKFYQAVKDNEKLLHLNYRLQVELAELCLLITESEAVCVLEGEGDLVRRAQSVLGSLRRRKRGAQAIEEARSKRMRVA